MTLDSLRIARNVLLRAFVIGFAFSFLLGSVTFGYWDAWIGLATRLTHADQAAFVPIVLNFFANLRFFMLFILLTPALAIHWTIKSEESSAKLHQHLDESQIGSKQVAYRTS